ncbi:hypothetical protein [Streptomyces sp. NPDC002913]
MTFHDHLQHLVERALASIPAADADDIYAVSFLIDNEDDDPRRPTLTIGYNTRTQARRSIQNTSNKPAGTTDARSRQLEAVRVVAQQHAYWSDQPQEVRRQWAKLSLLANRRIHGDGPGDPAREVQQDFMLRMWVIDRLGPDDKDPDWSPEKLASDTLDALALTPPQATALAGHWRDLPIEQVRELRQCKNLTAHLDRLTDRLWPGQTRDQLLLWTETRRLLP